MTRFRTILTLFLVTCFIAARPVQASDFLSPAAQAAAQFIGSLDAYQIERLKIADSLPLQFLRADQYKLYANFIRAQGTYEAMGVMTPGMRDTKVVAVPVYVNFSLAASIQVTAGTQPADWVPVFQYSQPTKLTPQAPGGGPNFDKIAMPNGARQIAAATIRFQSARKLYLAPYPVNVPIPETAYRRCVSVPFLSLSPMQQKFVRAVLAKNGATPPPSFDWNAATVRFARTLTFRGLANRGFILHARYNSFRELVW